MNGKPRRPIDFIPESFRPKKCPACHQSIRTGSRRNKWGFVGVSYNKRDKCFHSTIRIGKVVNFVSKCARTPEQAARMRARAMIELVSKNKIAKAANIRWRTKSGRERS